MIVNSINIATLCKQVGISRSGYYKERKLRKRQSINEEIILEHINSVRHYHPRMGCKKIYSLIKKVLYSKGISIGRDRLFGLMKKHKLLIKKRRSCKTTDSKHKFKVYKNLIKDFKKSGVNQVWVSDITYLKTKKGFLYLSLITDSYSRKIVGYEVNDNLETIGCIKALNKALKNLPKGSNLIHHSDRGTQYCSNEYTKKLSKNNILISMTEDNHCYENAQAERVNGILKHEYGLKEIFLDKKEAITACRQAVVLYNNYRPHLALKMKTPNMVHENLDNNLEFNLKKCVNF